MSAPEVGIATDMARKSVVVAAVLVAVSAVAWGVAGALSSAFAVALVVINFLAAAGLIAWSAPKGGSWVMGTVMGGYVLRLGVVTAALFLVKDAGWVERAPLFGTLLVTHLGLLLWEAKSVSLSLAHPGLKPALGHAGGAKKENVAR